MPVAVVLLVDLSLSGPGACLLAPWSGVLSVHLVERVVRRCYQGHSEQQLLVTPVHPQPSLPSSLRSANRGLRAGFHRRKRSHSNGNADLRKDACVVVVVVVVVVVRTWSNDDVSLAIPSHKHAPN